MNACLLLTVDLFTQVCCKYPPKVNIVWSVLELRVFNCSRRSTSVSCSSSKAFRNFQSINKSCLYALSNSLLRFSATVVLAGLPLPDHPLLPIKLVKRPLLPTSQPAQLHRPLQPTLNKQLNRLPFQPKVEECFPTLCRQP